MAKEKPTAGSFYTVQNGDTLEGIAQSVYGNSQKYNIIYTSNSLRSGNADTIYPGEKIWIPSDKPQPAVKEKTTTLAGTGVGEKDINIRFKDKLFLSWLSVLIERNIDSLADGFSITTTFNSNDTNQRENFKPFDFQDVEIFYGEKLILRGVIEKVVPVRNTSDTMVTFSGRTNAGILIDVMNTSSETSETQFDNQTLLNISNILLTQYGIKAFLYDGLEDFKFSKIVIKPEQKIFDFLNQLATEAGFLITSTLEGNLQYIKAKTTGDTVASLIDGQSNIKQIGIDYDSTKRYSHFIAQSQKRGANELEGQAIDESIKKKRTLVFNPSNSQQGNITETALWKRANSLSSSTNISITLEGWSKPNGEIWRENELITLLSPASMIYTETTFLIKNVKLSKNSSNGDQTVLGCVLPQAYTKEFPTVFPWDNK